MRRRTAYRVEALTTLGALATTTLLIVGSFDHFLRAYQIGDTTINAELPVWPSKLLVPIALSVLWLRLLLQLSSFVRLYKHPDSGGR